jgi:hypothetical protein
MKMPSLFLVFLFLLALGISEIPEELRLSDDASNDFAMTASETRSFETSPIIDTAWLASGNGSVEVAPVRTFKYFCIACAASHSHLSGQDRLLLCSIQRT